MNVLDWLRRITGPRDASDVASQAIPLPARAMALPRAVTLEQLARNPKLWVALLWRAMQLSGRGYRRYTLKNRPPVGASRWRGERRKDKAGTSKLERRLMLGSQIA